jgi:hypothetical protein
MQQVLTCSNSTPPTMAFEHLMGNMKESYGIHLETSNCKRTPSTPPPPKWKKLGLFGCMLSRLIGWKWTQFLIVLITTLILGYWQGHEMQGCASINYQVFFFPAKTSQNDRAITNVSATLVTPRHTSISMLPDYPPFTTYIHVEPWPNDCHEICEVHCI